LRHVTLIPGSQRGEVGGCCLVYDVAVDAQLPRTQLRSHLGIGVNGYPACAISSRHLDEVGPVHKKGGAVIDLCDQCAVHPGIGRGEHAKCTRRINVLQQRTRQSQRGEAAWQRAQPGHVERNGQHDQFLRVSH